MIIFKYTLSIFGIRFPFDQQKCEFKFSSWTYDLTELNLTLKSTDAETSSYMTNGVRIGEFVYFIRVFLHTSSSAAAVAGVEADRFSRRTDGGDLRGQHLRHPALLPRDQEEDSVLLFQPHPALRADRYVLRSTKAPEIVKFHHSTIILYVYKKCV